MALALIASPRDLDPELEHTVLGRQGFERQLATMADQARALARARRPDVILVDVFLEGAAELVSGLRGDPETRRTSIVALAGSDADPREVALLRAGANAVLRLPPGPGWNERLLRFVNIPERKAARFPVSFSVAAGPEAVPATGLNVSSAGLLLETWAELAVGDEVSLLFRLGGDILRARGNVVRVGAPRQFGVQFITLDTHARRAVERFVRA